MASLLGCAVSLFSSYFQSPPSPSDSSRINETEPFVRHKSLCKGDFLDKDILIIGDVHGCFDEMMHLLRLAEAKTVKPLVKIFVGDMINKGPKSEHVLDYIIKSKDTYCVRGNHEQKVLKEYFLYKKSNTIEPSERAWVKNLKPEFVNFMKNLPYTIKIPHLNLIIVHAGLLPGLHLSLQNSNEMINMRNLYWQDDMFHGKVLKSTYRTDKGDPWSELWQGPEHVYFGHDAVRRLQKQKHATGLDTGCVYGGQLTGVLLRLHDHKGIVGEKFMCVDPYEVYVPVND